MTTKIKINGQTMIPALLQASPETRVVLDQYGLRGCGGKLGPSESLAFFSNAHEVPLDKLLNEINEALEQRANLPTHQHDGDYKESLADSIYRPFFLAGIGVILTVGAVWGAYLLIRIGYLGSFTAVGIHEVNAHGHAQIFGWVGLFVMGFAYQAFPRFKHTNLLHPQLALATLWMMLGGILIRALCEPLGLIAPIVWNLIPIASAIEVAAIGLFIFIILKTLRNSGKPFAFYDRYIIASLIWFFIQGVYSGLLFWATAVAQNDEQLLHVISTWQAPLREIQIHGFATLMILGVSQRIFHNFYGLPKPSERKSKIAFVTLNIALIGNVVGFVLMRTSSHAWASLWYASILLMTSSIAFLLLNWKIYSKAADSDRSLKFLRAAYVWLMISLGMTVLLPLY
ncbi:NnrS family protein, partial [bacterium]|nr:NnrS family protein [bacterium]